GVGVHLVDHGRLITNSVDSPVTAGATQYICAGWILAGNDPTSGTGHVMTMTLTNDAVLAWQWTTNLLNPSVLSFSAETFTAAEASVSTYLTVIRTGGSNGEVSVSYRTADGTATGDRDYTPATGTVVLADGVTSNTAAVELFHDLQYEPDETVLVSLFNAAGATLAAPTGAVLLILDDDADLGQRTLDVVSAHGQPDPPAGAQVFDYGIRLTGSVTGLVEEGTTQYVGGGWAGTGSVPESPPPGYTNVTPAFLLTNNSSITWLWTTNVYFVPGAGPNGWVAGDAAGWYSLGAGVTVTAAPVIAYSFAGWEGDVPPGQVMDNPLSLILDQARAVTATFSPNAGENLLNNPSFEQAGTSAVRALYWDQGDPDTHGATSGTATRVNWRSYSGTWQGAIQGAYSGAGTEGEFWQEVPATPGEEYRFSGWFWADNGDPYGPWGAGEQVMKIEFYSGATQGVALLHAATSTLAGVVQNWESRSMDAVAPTNADWVRVVILARDVSYDGSMQMDDLKLEILQTLDVPAIQQVSPVDATSCSVDWSSVAEATGYVLDVATNEAFQPATRASDLFISEYGEGTGSERYIEIWNGTGSEVDLTAYRLWGISAGGSWFESSLALSNTLADGAVHVVVNNNCTSAVLRTAADQFAANTAPMNFSGDDAVGLARVLGVVTSLIDAVGTSGGDPGTGWGVAGVADATANHVLVRKSSITAGNTVWATCTNEWMVYSVNTWDDVDTHTMDTTAGDFVAGYETRDAGGVTSLTVTGLTTGVTYYFRVRATNAVTHGAWSGTYEATLDSSYGILATAGEHGSIAPSGLVNVAAGQGTNFIVQADPYYSIAAVTTNGAAISLPAGLSTYTVTWSQVTGTGTVHSSFAERLADAYTTPWWWLAAYELTNAETSFNEAELQDLDEDGHPAWAEYGADTDPGDPLSVLKASAVVDGTAAGYTIRWPGSTNRYYHVYGITNLAFDFERVASNLPGTVPVNIYTDTVFQSENPVYYRVRVLPAPEE
ncbi:MAG: lamin tail domain-containing protein, partial [Verrucomicrobia bacterium]|nr:lamin tail domain-containing protein [Verrucomicrobiota bacterium]